MEVTVSCWCVGVCLLAKCNFCCCHFCALVAFPNWTTMKPENNVLILPLAAQSRLRKKSLLNSLKAIWWEDHSSKLSGVISRGTGYTSPFSVWCNFFSTFFHSCFAVILLRDSNALPDKKQSKITKYDLLMYLGAVFTGLVSREDSRIFKFWKLINNVFILPFLQKIQGHVPVSIFIFTKYTNNSYMHWVNSQKERASKIMLTCPCDC